MSVHAVEVLIEYMSVFVVVIGKCNVVTKLNIILYQKRRANNLAAMRFSQASAAAL